MPKSILKILSLLFIFISGYAVAQKKSAAAKYLGGHVMYDRVDFYTQLKYPSARNVPDSLNVSIDNIAQLQSLVEHGLQNRLYGLEIMNAGRPDLTAIFNLLTKFPNLTCLQVFDPFFSHKTDKNYSIPNNIRKLQQLKVIQFANTSSLDVEDAINKISVLPHLEGIEFSGYHFPIINGLSKLGNISYMKLSTANLEGADVSNVKWKTLRLSGSLPKKGADIEVLKKTSQIKSLQSLYLNYCALGDGSALSELKQINTLSFSDCDIDSSNQIFNRISKLKKLKTLAILYIRDSTQVINGIEDISALKALTISYLPSLVKNNEQLIAINKLKNLEELKLGGKLTGFPDIFNGLNHLKHVNIAENALTTLPQSLFNLPQLEYLNASGNKIRELPKQFACKNLRVLDLSYNKLVSLPADMMRLQHLEKIDLTNNNLTTLPAGWQNLRSLKDLKLTANYLNSTPSGIEKLTGLESLDLSNNYISYFPDIPSNNYALRILKLNLNNLTVLPESIGAYGNLEVLGVAGNILKALPESLGKCTKLTELWVYSDFIRSHFDSDKIGLQQVVYDKPDSSHLNNIKALPKGLAAAKNLQKLNLCNNRTIDASSVFDVLLAMPRKSMDVNLSYDNIKQLPADSRWANMTFVNLDLSNNKLTTLPAQFANINLLYVLQIAKNPFKTVITPASNQVSSKAEMKIFFDELGVPLPNYNLSNKEYAQALCKRVGDLSYSRDINYERIVKYANQALTIDPDTYAKVIGYDNIGTARYFTKDYKGAIKDFDAYLEKEKKGFLHIMNFIAPVLQYKAEAQLALGQTLAAAQTYEYWGKNYYSEGVWQKAAVLYKTASDDANYKRVMDSALLYTQRSMAFKAKSKSPLATTALDYAELLIIAGKPAQAIEMLNAQPQKQFVKTDNTLKSYLVATANSINNTAPFDDLTKSVKQSVVINGKPTNWDFTMFNRWLRLSGFSDAKQKQLLALQSIIK